MYLTVNQIVLLLEIYRGAIFSNIMGNYEEDLEKLEKLELVVTNKGTSLATGKGQELVTALKLKTKDFLN